MKAEELLKRYILESDVDYRVRIGLMKLDDELPDVSWDEIVEFGKFDMTGDHFRKRAYGYKDMADAGYKLIPENNVSAEMLKRKFSPSRELLADGTQVSEICLAMTKRQSKDEDFMLEAHGYDPLVWEVITSKNSMWNQHNKQDGTLELYSSRVSVRPRRQNLTPRQLELIFTRIYKTFTPRKVKKRQYSKTGKMLELNIADLHLGKLCWIGDSNDVYDEKIAEERFFYIIEEVMARCSHIPLEKILFVWSNDFFHVDSPTKSTTKGTPQDTNLQYHQMYELGCSMLVRAVDYLRHFAPVETMYISSNHDQNTSYHACVNLASWFRNDAFVTVDASPLPRKFVEYGNCLIGFTHGHEEGKKIGKMLSIDQREAWGRTKFHEVHAAHFHSERQVTDENGTIVRYMPSPTSTDRWHYAAGWIGAVRSSQSFIWDREKGLENIIVVNV